MGAALLLSGCNALLTEGTADVAGLTGAAVSKGLGASGAAAAGIGLGVQTGARAGLQYTQRRLQKAEQDSIAAAAGPLPAGAVARWSVAHQIPIADDHQGEVTISREIGALGLSCREIVFSIEGRPEKGQTPRDFYTAIICRNGTQWKWASAEPATERWGSLQ